MAYVSFAQWVAVILVYTLVYHMMEPPLEYYEIVEEAVEIEEQREGNDNDVSRPLLVQAEWPGIEDKETEHSKTPFIARIFKSATSDTQTGLPYLDLRVEEGGNSPELVRLSLEW